MQSEPLQCWGCVYEVNYKDGSRTRGYFSQETFTLGSDSFQGFTFECGHSNTRGFKGSIRLLGLGKTAFAFRFQTKRKYGGQFSYFLIDFLSSTVTGSLNVGQSSIPATAAFTPLTLNSDYPSFYFMGLNSISVRGERLSSPHVTLGG